MNEKIKRNRTADETDLFLLNWKENGVELFSTEQTADREFQLFVTNRFFEEQVGFDPFAFGGGVDREIETGFVINGRNHNDRKIGLVFFHMESESEPAVRTFHSNIDDGQIVSVGREKLTGFLGGFRFGNFKTVRFEQRNELLTKVVVIVNKKNFVCTHFYIFKLSC